MSMKLRHLPHAVAGRVLPIMAAGYIRMVRSLVRWRWIGRPAFDDLVASRRPLIVAFWHGRILMITPLIEETPLHVKVMISNNRDGEMISRVIARFGASSIRGSTRDKRKSKEKGGRLAYREAVEHLNGGGVVALTPDGPRGPRMRAQIGVAAISAQTGAHVVPVAYSIRRSHLLRSWDRFMLPLPWGRGCYVIGPALAPPTPDDEDAIEEYRLQIEAALTEATAQADAAVGLSTPEPADPVRGTA